MSLNGLEATELNDAYQSALGEAGGWFLLKYISRDEVALLEKGNGGLAEVEEVISRYEEQSPLYGFIQYRRRKVILKYIPEGTSRLLQARVTVQFQSIIEKLSPHDTVFSFAQSTDLRDSALSSACSLHTATASIKSSNDSVTQKGLAEITEDVSDSRADIDEVGLVHGGIAGDEEHWPSMEDTQIGSEKVNGSVSADRSSSATTQSSFRPRTTSNTDKPLPTLPSPEEHTREEVSCGSVLEDGEYNTTRGTDGRFSSNSTRPSTRDLYDAYGYKKKAKMGPRPSSDSVGTPNNTGMRTDEFRPVSTLPAGLRMPSRKALPARPASRQTQASSTAQTTSPARPNAPVQANSSEKMTPKKAPVGSVVPISIPDQDMPIPNNGLRIRTPESTSAKMTPERQRLMKALKLRKEQIAAQISVKGLGIKDDSEESEFAKSEIDDSILSAVIDASTSTERPEPVPIATKDLAKEGPRLLEDSPISIPETAEELSTQASSITDEEVITSKRPENPPTSIPSVSEQQGSSDVLDHKPHSHLAGRSDVTQEHPTRDAPIQATLIESPQDLSQFPAPTHPESSAAGQHVVDHKIAGKDAPESINCDFFLVTNEHTSAEEVGREKQLSPPQVLDSQTLGNESIINGDVVLLPDRDFTSTAELNEYRESSQSEPLGGHDKASSLAEAFTIVDLLQGQSLGDSQTSDQAQVLESQSREGHRQSLENTITDSDETAPGKTQTEVVQSLLERRSSSSKSINILSDNVNAHEVPLPPIDEDEEISLSPQRALFREETATHHPHHTGGELGAAILQAEILSQNSDPSVIGQSTSHDVGERYFWRQGAVNPIKRVSSPDQSDEQFLSDDSFMEELKSATVQEAKPVSVSKSPIKPVFSRSESEQRSDGPAKASRSVSTPIDHSAKEREVLSSPRPPSLLSMARSFSAQHAPPPDTQQSNVQISKKSGVSSSISQRIKALEQLSSRPTSPVSPKLAPNVPTFLGLRTTSLRTPSGGSDQKNSTFNKSRPVTAYPSPSPSPENIKSSPPNRSNKPEYSRPAKPATATTVLDARKKPPEILYNSSKPRHLDLQEKALQLEAPKSSPPAEQKPMGPPPLSPLKPPRPRFGRYSSTRSGSSSSNEQKLESQPATRRDSFASIRSKSSRAGSEVESTHTLSEVSPSGVANLDSTQDEKKDSRRSRLLKRMSSISSMSRRSIAHALSPSPKEAPIIERQEPVPEAPSTYVEVGDVNVQFPDNLLWKRRHMVIDAHGVLILSASKLDTNSKIITKRYPLSEFHPPYIPDQDRQELPNSVVLDFKDGSTLQCACEHLQGQTGVLKALRHAHSTVQAQ